MPVQVARRRTNSRRGSRLGRREMRGRTANFNDELARDLRICLFWHMFPLDDGRKTSGVAAWRGEDASVLSRSQSETGFLLRRLQSGDSIEMPISRPMPGIGANCHELRVQDG